MRAVAIFRFATAPFGRNKHMGEISMANEKAHRAIKAAIYCRVASPGPITRELLDTQRQRLERYAAEHHIEVIGTYEDNGYPGNTLTAPVGKPS